MEDRFYTEEWMPKLFKGERPSEDLLGASPLMTDWDLVVENDYLALSGSVFAHPKFNNGEHLTTSKVFWMDPQMQYARTKSRWIRLAAPAVVMT